MLDMPGLADLLDLQEIDLAIDRLLHRRETLPELEQYRTVVEERTAAQAGHDRQVEEFRAVDLESDKNEGELQILEQKLEESETRLFAGGMSAKETEHKRMEVQSLRSQKSAMEDRLLRLLDEREALERRVEAARAALEEIKDREATLEATISATWKEIDAEVARKEGRKMELVGPIDPDLLSLYEKLRKTKEGVAVGRLEDGVCGGCHLTLSPAEQSEAGADDPPRCIHCRRLLVM